MKRTRGLTSTLVCSLTWGFMLATSASAQSLAPVSLAKAVSASHSLADGIANQAWLPQQISAALAGRRGEFAFLWLTSHTHLALHSLAHANDSWLKADELAEQLGYIDQHLLILEKRAEIALMRGDYDASKSIAVEMLNAARGNRNPLMQAMALGYLGIIERRRGDLDASLTYHEQAIALLRQGRNEARLALVISNLGTVQRDRGDYAKALELQLEALAIRERIGDRLENSLRNVALLYREIEDERSARAYFARALSVAEERANPQTLAPALGSYASLLNDLGDHAGALTAAREALAIELTIGNPSNLGLEHLEIGRALAGLGERTEAREMLESALEIGRNLRQSEIVARALLHLAELAQAQHDQLRARGLVDEAIARLESTRLRPQLAQAYAVRERIALAQHDQAGALRYLRRYGEQRELLLGTRASRQLSALQARHARAEAEQSVALLQKDNELQKANLRTQELQRRLGIGAMISLLLALGLLIWRFSGVSRLNRTLQAKNREIDAQRQALHEANAALAERAKALYQAAISDPLTGVFNRAHLREQLNERLAFHMVYDSSLAVLVVDFDHFKQINDSLGHLHGDRVLIEGVKAMRESLGAQDLIGRFGGEEFVIVLENRDAPEVHAIAENLRQRVQEAMQKLDALCSVVTISVGFVMVSQIQTPSVDALLDAADRAMYAAKAAGRNRVMQYLESNTRKEAEALNHG
jgi:diguanylate cyclase (GGDEF)-like protein